MQTESNDKFIPLYIYIYIYEVCRRKRITFVNTIESFFFFFNHDVFYVN